MKICPKCSETYADDNLNFCLNDGELLQQTDDAPPTMILDAPRVTNETNWQQYQAPSGEAPASWQNPAQSVQNPPPGLQNFGQSKDQTLPTVALVLGILSLLVICCYGGFPLGLAAIVTGFLGMKNADANPTRYGGRGMAIAGMVLGVISLISSVVFIFVAILAN